MHCQAMISASLFEFAYDVLEHVAICDGETNDMLLSASLLCGAWHNLLWFMPFIGLVCCNPFLSIQGVTMH